MSTWRALASSNQTKVEQLSDDDWETDGNFENDVTEKEQRWGSKTVEGSGRLKDDVNFKQVIEDIQIEDKKVKEKYIHVSQKDAAAGFGGKFGVQKDRVDKSAVGFDYHAELNKHESQKDHSQGFGGKFGVQKDRKDQSAVGFDYHASLNKHESQISTTKPAIVNRIKVPEFKDEQENKPNNDANRSIGKVKVPDFQTEKQAGSESNQNKSVGKIKVPKFENSQETIESNQNKSVGKIKVPSFENSNDTSSNRLEKNKPVSTGKLKLPKQFVNAENEEKTPPKTAESVHRGNANALKSKFESLIKDSDSENQRKIEEERLRRLQKEKDEKNKAKQEEEERQRKLKIEAEQRKLNEEEEIKKSDQSGSDEEQVISSKVNKVGVSVLPSMNQLTKQISKTSNRSSSFDSDNENDFNDEEEKIDETKNSNKSIVNKIVNVETSNVNETHSNQEEEEEEALNREREAEEIRRLKELELQRELEEEELRKKLAEEDESAGEDVNEGKEVSEIRAVAIYDYEAAESDEISFLPGDVICEIEKVDSGWWRGKVVDGDGRVGLFPSNYVEELN